MFHDGKWHVFMTVKLPARSAIEYCCFNAWQDAKKSPRTILTISDSDYYCAPQVFYFTPHKKWYLIYQVGMAGSDKMWVAYSTTADLNDPRSWTTAQPMLDGGAQDPRPVGGLDYWIICDTQRAYLFLTNLNGQMWRLWTRLEDFPRGFHDPAIALQAKIFEASHTYRLEGQNKYLTIVEEDRPILQGLSGRSSGRPVDDPSPTRPRSHSPAGRTSNRPMAYSHGRTTSAMAN